MARSTPKPAKPEADESAEAPTTNSQLAIFLKANKASHFNFEKSYDYTIPLSSLAVNAQLNGGIRPGAHRATGINAGGKTSFTLDGMNQFLKDTSSRRRGIYIKAEGRLPKEMQERTGVKFVFTAEEWVDGTCFVFESNVFEVVFSLLGELIRNNEEDIRYYIVIDSLDNLIRQADLDKTFSDATQVAGGAVITTLFLKKTQVALAKRGHVCWFISQLRDTIKGPYEKTVPRQGNASGGHAVEHAGDIVLEFLPRWNDDYIRESDAKDAKIIGHYARVKIVKSNNEKYGVEVCYPIRYGRTGGNSVWVEREIVDMLLPCKLLERTGSWFVFNKELREEMVKDGIDIPEKVQGINGAYALFETNIAARDWMYKKLVAMLNANA